MTSPILEINKISSTTSIGTGQEILKSYHSNELFIAIVGPAGAGAGTAAKLLEAFFEDSEYEAKTVKASTLIRETAIKHGLEVPAEDLRKSIGTITKMQDRGDDLRQGNYPGGQEDHSAVARLVLRKIAKLRAELQGKPFSESSKVEPDGRKRVYVIDSLRHPAEVQLLRSVYQDAFALVGVVCDPAVRERRIRENLFDRSVHGHEKTKREVKNFLERDENSPQKFGQHVSDTFQESDFFVDNTEKGDETLSVTGMNDSLKRFVSLIGHNKIVRPTISETAMHQARSAQMRSACLSRQVGAALVDGSGNIVATGTNEAPKAGGGVYGEGFDVDETADHRCAFRETVYCSSNREQNEIIEELIDTFPNLTQTEKKYEILKKIRKTRVGSLLEFSRAVHAEMDAILSASLSGVSTKGCRLYVTTYPCHYCARHIVAAGIDEVQFIEPYPKSKATDLHSDAITTESDGWVAPSKQPYLTEEGKEGHFKEAPKVLFKPFVGVSPRMYRRVFLKDRDYKNKVTGERIEASPDWSGPLDSLKISYVELELELGLGGTDG
ncbi:anti-phage dCTP deaminase [Roseibium sp. AS2]|uniref:anti-phage dCTP deaminase n=1 Tax=Roseibium sp. AS2 TaxID=3135781 RepID=UPI0031710AA2